MKRPVEIGTRLGRLVVTEVLPERARNGYRVYLCSCDCGNRKKVISANIHRTKSCGCLKREPKLTHRIPDGGAALNELYSKTKRGAVVHRNYEWGISKEDFRNLTSQPCHYCGAPPVDIFNKGRYSSDYKANGLDRVDNLKGYILENVVPCCERCNRAKFTGSYGEFQTYLDRLVAFRSRTRL